MNTPVPVPTPGKEVPEAVKVGPAGEEDTEGEGEERSGGEGEGEPVKMEVGEREEVGDGPPPPVCEVLGEGGRGVEVPHPPPPLPEGVEDMEGETDSVDVNDPDREGTKDGDMRSGEGEEEGEAPPLGLPVAPPGAENV